MAAIPIGGDPEDFSALAEHRPASRLLAPDRINLSYVGAFLPRAEPLARQVMKALSELRRERPQLAARLRLNFVGTSNQPDGKMRLVTPIAESEGVSDLVVERPARVPFLEALGLLSSSDGLLLIGSDERHYTASKIYPALMSGTPFLSLFHRDSSAHQILSDAGGGLSFAFADASELGGLTPDLTAGLALLSEQPGSLGRADATAYADFTDVFDQVLQGRR
jgi:hypothetical protein